MLEGLAEKKRGNPARKIEAAKAVAGKPDGGDKRSLRATIVESRRPRRSRRRARRSPRRLLAVLQPTEGRQAREDRRYVDKLSWWDDYDDGNTYVRLANRSTATLSTVLITNRALPGGEGYLIDVGTIALHDGKATDFSIGSTGAFGERPGI